MPDIPLLPWKTCLTVLGYGRNHAADAAEHAFAESAQAVIALFQEELGLPEENVLSNLDPEGFAGTGSELFGFLGEKDPENLFVYLCAHGETPGTQPEDEKAKSAITFRFGSNSSGERGAVLDFRDLVVRVARRMKSSKSFRLAVFVVDACFSGVCHSIVKDVGKDVGFPESAHVLVITSNHEEAPALVQVCEDKGRGDRATFFTECFLKVVKEGLAGEGDEDRSFMCLGDICERVKDEILGLGFFGTKDETFRKAHSPSCSSFPKDAVKECRVFRNVRVEGSLEARLLDDLCQLSYASSKVKGLKKGKEDAERQNNETTAKYRELERAHASVVHALNTYREKVVPAVKGFEQFKNELHKRLSERHEEIQKFGNGLDRRLSERDERMQEFGGRLAEGLSERHEEIREFANGLDGRLSEQDERMREFDGRLDSRLSELHEEMRKFDNGLDRRLSEQDERIRQFQKESAGSSRELKEELLKLGTTLEGLGERLTKDVEVAAAECRKWRKLSWIFGVFGCATGVALAYVFLFLSKGT